MVATPGRERGFSLLEVMFVALVLVPILGSIVGTTQVINDSIKANGRATSAAEKLRTTAQRIAMLARGGVLSTCQVKANADDIAAAQAGPIGTPIPALGEWIAPPVGAVRDNLRFRSADGALFMNAAAVTPFRSVEFVLDSAETANGLDDDGDGLVDEGRIDITIDTMTTSTPNGVEQCRISVSGKVVIVSLRYAIADRGRVYRAALDQRILMRNN